ncbi:hypothetical protein [Euzebya sp.]|uniref:hypothetical protein n=1 Tax=Euzebya sp. TaxID=1971409 RepID=UPI003511FF39
MGIPRQLIGLVVALAIAGAGCADPSGGGTVVDAAADGRFEFVELDEVQIWRSAQPSTAGLDALVRGTVEYDEACGAVLHDEEVDVRYPVVWPHGTGLVGTDPLTLELSDGRTVTVGDVVSGGGGYHPDLALVDDACAPTGETAVFNASGAVEVTMTG